MVSVLDPRHYFFISIFTVLVSRGKGSSSCSLTLPDGATVKVDTLKLMEEMKKLQSELLSMKKEVEEGK